MNFGPKDRAVRYTVSLRVVIMYMVVRTYYPRDVLDECYPGQCSGTSGVVIYGYVRYGIGYKGWNHAGLQF
jgi:hypothetical protein